MVTVMWHFPFVHVGPPSAMGHAVMHTPQWFGSDCRSSQPFIGLPSQSAVPAPHVPPPAPPAPEELDVALAAPPVPLLALPPAPLLVLPLKPPVPLVVVAPEPAPPVPPADVDEALELPVMLPELSELPVAPVEPELLPVPATLPV
jgi:hypothetical protein